MLWRASPFLPVSVLMCLGTAPAWAQEPDTLMLRADYTLKTDSNLYRLSSSDDVLAKTGRDSAAERIAITTVGLSFNKAYSLQRLELDLNLVDYSYQNFDQFSYTANNYAGAWRWSLTPRFFGNLSTARQETLNSFADYQGITPVNQRNLRANTTTAFDANFDVDGTWRLLAGLSRTNQTNQLTLGTGDDYSANSASVGVRRASGSNSTLSYIVKKSSGKYLNASANNREFNQLDNEVRLNWVLTGKTTADISATHINRSHPGDPQRDYSGFNTGVNVTWNATGKTALAASWVRQLGSYQTGYASYTQTDRLSLGPTWQVGRKTTAGLRYDLTRIDYRGAPAGAPSAQRQDTLRDLSLNLKWQPHRLVALSAALTKSTRDATATNLPSLDYRGNTASLTAQFSF